MPAKRYTAKVVFLNASTLGSTQILLNSTSESFPTGIGNRSGVLGHYLMDHPYLTVSGVIPGLLDKYTIGNRPAGVWMPRFHNVEGQTAPFLRGFSYEAGASRANWTDGVSMPGYGAALKQRLREYGPWSFGFYGFLECLPNRDNTLTLDPVRKDKWGMPILNTRFEWGKNEPRAREADGQRCDADVEERRRDEHLAASRGDAARRIRHPRDGHGAHGARSRDLIPEWPQPVS